MDDVTAAKHLIHLLDLNFAKKPKPPTAMLQLFASIPNFYL